MTKKMFYPLMLLIFPLIGTILSDQVDWGILRLFNNGSYFTFCWYSYNCCVSENKTSKKETLLQPCYTVYLFFALGRISSRDFLSGNN